MKRLLVAVVVTLALGLAPSLVQTGAHADSLHTYAVGGGDASCTASSDTFCPYATAHFAFSAHCNLTSPVPPFTCTDADMTNPPSGHVVYRFTVFDPETNQTLEVRVQGPVTCLSTDAGPQGTGGVATITFQVTRAVGFPSDTPVPPYATFVVYDSGQQSAMPDTISELYGSTQSTANDCARPYYPLGEPVTQGNIDVALQSPLLGSSMQGSWYQTDTAGNLYTLENGTWTLVQ